MAFVQAYNTATGEKQRVPEHWIGHPTLGVNLSLAPSARQESAPEPPAGAPEEITVDDPQMEAESGSMAAVSEPATEMGKANTKAHRGGN